jgi:hypothetical protein
LRLFGWKAIKSSVMINRVGRYIFDIDPETAQYGTSRILLDISVIDGRKVIEVQSTIILENKLDLPVELRLEFPNTRKPPVNTGLLAAGVLYPIPVDCTGAVMKLRPCGAGYEWSTTALSWEQTSKAQAQSGHRDLLLSCRKLGSEDEIPK